MSNSFYNAGSFPATGAPATSASMRAELALIAGGFDKLPTLSGNGNKLVTINAGGTGMTVLTPPSGDLVGTTATQTLTNKTLNLTSNTLAGTLAQFNTALSDADFASLAGVETLTNKTISGASNTLTNIGNASLSNSSLTIGSTNISLGGTSTTLAGLSSVTSTSFVGSLTGAASLNVLKAGDTMTGNLTVNTGADSRVLLQSTGTTQGQLQTTASLVRLASNNTLPLVLSTNGVDRLTLDDVGNVTFGATGASGVFKVQGNNTGDLVVFESTDASATAAPDVVLYRSSASPAASDQVGNLIFRGKDSGGADQSYARILSTILDPTAGAEAGDLRFGVQTTSGFNDLMTLAPTGLSLTGGLTLSSGTANGVAYLNASKVLTTGSALTFDGTNISANNGVFVSKSASGGDGYVGAIGTGFRLVNLHVSGAVDILGNGAINLSTQGGSPITFTTAGSEQMRLTSTGLGIGTSSPAYKLDVVGVGKASSAFAIGDSSGNLSGTMTNESDTSKSVTFNADPGNVGASSFMRWNVDGSERMRLDSFGNLGLGVTPSAWNSDYRVSQIGINSAFYGRVATPAESGVSANAYRNSGGTWTYVSTAAATRYEQSSGSNYWYTAPSGTAGNAISFTQAATLSGTSSPALRVGVTADLQGFNFQAANAVGFSVHSSGSSSTAAYFSAAANVTLSSSGNFAVINGTDGILFGSAGTERARITSGGSLVVGDTSSVGSEITLFKQTAGAGSPVTRAWNNETTGSNEFIEFGTEGTYTNRGGITYNRAGGLVAYNTTSDYRAKDILGPIANPGATIDALKVYEGKMKGATQSRPMLVAHEAQAIAPYAVTGEKDAVNEDGDPIYQQMDVSSLVPLLLAEIQSLRARVAALEAQP